MGVNGAAMAYATSMIVFFAVTLSNIYDLLEKGKRIMNKKYCIFAAQFLPHMGGIENYTYNISKELIKKRKRSRYCY